jgi:hypothetical protein
MRNDEGKMRPIKIFFANESTEEKKLCLKDSEVIFSAKVNTDG